MIALLQAWKYVFILSGASGTVTGLLLAIRLLPYKGNRHVIKPFLKALVRPRGNHNTGA